MPSLYAGNGKGAANILWRLPGNGGLMVEVPEMIVYKMAAESFAGYGEFRLKHQ